MCYRFQDKIRILNANCCTTLLIHSPTIQARAVATLAPTAVDANGNTIAGTLSDEANDTANNIFFTIKYVFFGASKLRNVCIMLAKQKL
jgi:hypothetical protein